MIKRQQRKQQKYTITGRQSVSGKVYKEAKRAAGNRTREWWWRVYKWPERDTSEKRGELDKGARECACKELAKSRLTFSLNGHRGKKRPVAPPPYLAGACAVGLLELGERRRELESVLLFAQS